MKKTLTLFVLAAFIGFTDAQVNTPAASTHATSTTTVGMTEVSVDYSRPNKRDRVIFGNLVPFGKIWRTGANANTTIEFGHDVVVGGQNLKAGKYSVFTRPGENSWEVFFFDETNNWGNSVSEDQLKHAVKTTASVKKLPYTAETFTISVDDLTYNSAMLKFLWDTTLAELPIEVPTDQISMASIEETMKGEPGARDYVAAATYYYNSGRDAKQAMIWMDKGVSMMDNAAYFTLYQQALIHANAGDKKGALELAKKAKKGAEEGKNPDYVKLTTDLIAELN